MKRWLSIVWLVCACAWAQSLNFRGLIQCRGRGWTALRTQAEYQAFVDRLPKDRVQMKQPAPPSQDPLLKMPPVDFRQHALVAVWSHNIHIEARVVEAHLEGDDMKVELSFETPRDYRNYAAPDGFGQYHLVEVEPFGGELKVDKVDEP